MPKQQEFKLERYKYILQEIHFLNENIHKYLALFQGLATAIIGGGIAIFTNWRTLGMTPEVAQVGIYALLGLLCLLALFVILYIVSGILSWLDYRKEEAELLDDVVSKGFRSKPNVSNFWRWHETWLIFSIITFVVVVYVFVEYQVLPLIK